MTRVTKAGLLFLFFALCASSLFVSHKLREHLPAPAPRELFAIVNEQLTAFRSADFQSAYRCSATVVQHKFTLNQFEKMVRQNYHEMTNSRRVEYGVVKVQGESAVVQVFFFAADDSVRTFLYSMIKEDNSWRIDGVEELHGYRTSDQIAGTHA